MTESMPFDHETDANDNVVELPTDSERIDPRELPVSAIIRQFLSQGIHPSVGKGEPVAEYIIFTLGGSSSDEWAEILKEQKLYVNDAQFDALIETDKIFELIVTDLRRSIKDTPKGERMSLPRRALMELMELRAGENLRALGRPDADNDDSWNQLLHKLSPDTNPK